MISAVSFRQSAHLPVAKKENLTTNNVPSTTATKFGYMGEGGPAGSTLLFIAGAFLASPVGYLTLIGLKNAIFPKKK